MTIKERIEQLFPVNERTHKNITDGEMRWLLERCFLPGPFLWTWDFEGSPYYRLNHGHGQYDDGTGGQGPGWWADRFNDPGDPSGGQVTGKFFRTPWEALADVLSKE